MANDMCTRRLTRELKSIQRNPLTNPRVYTTPIESNILEWHYVVEGSSGTPYEGGYYWGKLIFPKEYPLKPPSVLMLTPNGRFQVNRRLCLSMSDFHPESWNPMWSVSTILTGLISFMVESSPTLGSIETSLVQKHQFAKYSLDFNVKDETFCKLFPDLIAIHEDRLEKRIKALGPGGKEQMKEDMNLISSGLKGDGGGILEMQGFIAGCAGLIAFLSVLFAFRFL